MVKYVILALILSACTTSRGDFCKLSEPHSFSKEAIAAMSDEEVANELTHNLMGKEFCGWKART